MVQIKDARRAENVKLRGRSHPPTRQSSSTRSPHSSRDAAPMEAEDLGRPSTPQVCSADRISQVVGAMDDMYHELPDATKEACTGFTVIDSCIYTTRSLGGSENLGSMGCDCAEELESGTNIACDDDSGCINRATKIECTDDECACGTGCQNQRFQRKAYADVSVITTEQKGYGLRANCALEAHSLVFEYIGEVINESVFRKRMPQYSNEGIRHFYFMSLSKGVFIDATKKGNLGRFCNHSCRPNCYVDKWVVGEKLRMGIFTAREIEAGEELVFNYNVDRYGADPQRCYCGESNCIGFIGGRTQTERATKLSTLTLAALGLEDDDAWDVAVAKPAKKKKTTIHDPDYEQPQNLRLLDRAGVQQLVAAMILERERWVVLSILDRLLSCSDESVLGRVVVLHGYNALNAHLLEWANDAEILRKILEILHRLPRLSKNKIEDAHIEPTVQSLTSHEDAAVSHGSQRLLEDWAALEHVYRIPRKKKERSLSIDPDIWDPFQSSKPMKRPAEEPSLKEISRSRAPGYSMSRPSYETSRNMQLVAPQAPRGWASSGRNGQWSSQRRGEARQLDPPRDWSTASHDGRQIYYTASGKTTWQRPTAGEDAVPPPPLMKTTEQRLQDIVDGITKAGLASNPVAQTRPSIQNEEPKGLDEAARWRSLPIDKQKRLYENALSTIIRGVMRRFYSKLSKEELKSCGREIGKKIVESDYRHSRVKDQTKIDDEQRTRIVKFATQSFQKAAFKQQKLQHKGKEAVEQKPDQAFGGIQVPLENDRESLESPVADSPQADHQASLLESPATDEGKAREVKSLKRKTLHDEVEPYGSPQKPP